MKFLLWPVSLFFFILCLGVHAEEAETAQEAASRAQIETWITELKFQQGKIDIGNGLAAADIPADFKYLNPKDSSKLLELYGNPPSKNLGIIFPAAADLMKGSTWFVVLQYDEDGHVKDDDAEKINYTELLGDIQKSMKENNVERAKEGYPSIDLVRWAAPPHYDKTTHKLYWAKELAFEGEPDHTLNYNLRLLGRKGVLVLNAVAGIEMLPEIEAATPQVLAMVDFKPGNRYADFNEGTDRVATYGLAALVAGGVAAKAGFFKGLFIALLAAKKFVIMGVIALGAAVKKFFGARGTARDAE